jgi:hypothetical protein
MHDLDRTLLDTEYPEAFTQSEPDETDWDGALSPAEELELASELLEVGSDEELEQFLGDLIKKAAGTVRNFARSATGRSLGHLLSSAFKQVILPTAQQALNTYITASVQHGDEGGGEEGQLAPDAGRLLGLELEGLSPEDREFEVCRQLVRLASSAAQQASLAPPQADPGSVARQAVAAAASTYAPGLLDQGNGRPGQDPPRSGRWVRRGHTITLYGVYGPAANGGQP